MKRLGILTFCCFVPWIAWSGVPSFGDPVEIGIVQDSPLKEASGLTVSQIQPGVLYAHNDGATEPTVIAIDTQARYLATFKLRDFRSGDFEDIAVGPGPSPNLSYLYLGDIGDNRLDREVIVVYQIPEPWVDLRWSEQPTSANLGGGQAFRLQYPDQPHDAETLLVDPLRRELFVIAKESGVARVFKISIDQMTAGDINPLEWVLDMPFHMASGGSISPDGTQILLRNEDVAEWRLRSSDQSVEEALSGEGFRVPVVGRPIEPNGEAIGFALDGNGYFTLSDDADPPALYFVARSMPPYGVGEEELISAGSEWRYLDTGADLGVAWRQPDYPDAAWKVGRGAFGYGDDRLSTTVLFGGNAKKRHITTYFRTRFLVSSVAHYESFELRYLVDDGCAVFLNGAPVARANLAESAAFDTRALEEQLELESCWFKVSLPPGNLRAGVNTLSVEVHQHTPDSKDLRFDLQLVGKRDPRSRLLGMESIQAGKRLRLQIPTLERVIVQTSENLQEWEDWTLVEPFESLTSVLDMRSERTQRFYRVTPAGE